MIEVMNFSSGKMFCPNGKYIEFLASAPKNCFNKTMYIVHQMMLAGF